MDFLKDGFHDLKEGYGAFSFESKENLLVSVDFIFFDYKIVVQSFFLNFF